MRKLVARYYLLPSADLNIRFLVQIDKPVPLVPMTIQIAMVSATPSGYVAALKKNLWHYWLSERAKYEKDFHYEAEYLKGVFDVEEVELIECDLLVPKKDAV